LALAVLMHLLLFGLLFVGLNWQTPPDDVVQAELWVPPSPVVNPVPPIAPPEPAPVAPPPPPPPPPRPAAPPAPPKPPPEPAPDIKAEQRRKEQERRDAERKEAARKDAERKETERKEAERKEQARKDAERKEAERKDTERKEQARKDAERKEAAKKEAERKAQEEQKRRADEAAADARRAEDVRRIQQQAGNAGQAAERTSAGAASGAAVGGRSDTGYAGRVAAAIRANTTFQIPADLDGNPKAIFAVQLKPDCSLSGVRLLRSSGVPAWDAAAERGIARTDRFPRPADGPCPTDLEISRGPRDTAADTRPFR
jgi:colicin import membrane protein